MQRISNNLTHENTQFHMRRREYEMARTRDQIGTQSKVQSLRDDPIAAAHGTRFKSFRTRLERYSKNIEFAQSNHRYTAGQVRQGVDMLQRIREIAVQGANGTYTPDDMRLMASEVDELLKEFVSLGNSKNGDGSMIFGGTRTRTEPFRIVEGNVPGAQGAHITAVEYVGDINVKTTEVSENSHMQLNFPGNEVFWAENQTLISTVDAGGYQVQQDSVVRINGREINLTEGDTIGAVIGKINNAGLSLRARLDPVQNSLSLETTTPHQLWIEDSTGTVLQDLGVVSDGTQRPPANIAPSADHFGGSMFDVVISLRDALFAGDQEAVGGAALGGVDSGLNTMLSRLGDLGAQSQRLDFIYQRTEQYDIPEGARRESNELDIDLAEAVTDLRMLEHTHRAALSAASRVLQPTLLDFLR